ncbi:unnamed protein product, partial [Brenthis ino]
MKILLLLLEIVLTFGQNRESTNDPGSYSRILSRKKRHLIFPDGSSFQLVFCTQTHGYLQVGDIVWFGNTAALAWELPTDPKLFNYFKKYDKIHTAENRDGASKLIYFLDENGKVLSKKPYHKRIIVNPAFAKRSVDGHLCEEKEINKTSIQELRKRKKYLNVLKNLESDAIEFHREGRKSLYAQLEIFIQALGWRGRDCVLRLLCEYGNTAEQEHGTFLKEIIRAIFTLPQGRVFDGDFYREYDTAYTTKEDCANLYPHCRAMEQINPA